MRRFLSLSSLLVAFFAALSVSAHASTITAGTYALNANAPGGTLTGNITFSAAGQVSGVQNLTFNDAQAGNPTFTSFSNGNNNGYQDVTLTGNSGQVILYFATSSSSDVNLLFCTSACSPFNANDSYLHLYNSYNNYQPANLTGGTLSASVPAAAVTPEPSSIVLLGTGVLGVAGAVRRRFGKMQ